MRATTYHFPRRVGPRWVGFLAIGLVASTAGCDTSKMARTFGLTRDAPDEFTVTTQAPLSMPPDFNLRPPRPGAVRPQQQSERTQAEEALVPQLALGAPRGTASAGQSALLQESGPTAPADVRRRVDQDARLEQASESFLDRVLYWRKPDTQNVMVDPGKESQRLRQNAALGQPTDAGVTPVIQPRKRGWFQSLFSFD